MTSSDSSPDSGQADAPVGGDAVSHDRGWRANPLLPGLCLVAALVLVYHGVPGHEFTVFDDNRDLYQNPHLNPAPQWAFFWTHTFTEVYRPMVYMVLGALCLIARLGAMRHVPGDGASDLNPQIFHGADLLFHIANTLLVYAILHLLTRSRRGAGAGALLFGLHPLQAETVSWVMGINDLLSGCLSLLALWQYLVYSAHDADPKRYRHYAVAVICFVGALFAKPAAGAIPLTALVIDLVVLRRPWRASAAALLPWLLVALAWIPVTRSAMAATSQVIPTPAWSRPLVAGDALAFYLGKLAWPARLCFDYGRTPAVVLGHGWAYITWIAPVGLAALAWVRRREWPWLAAGTAVFFVALLPVSGLVSFVFQAWSTVADRYCYLALLGPALGLALLMGRIRASWTWGAVVVLLAAYGVRTGFQCATWQDNFALYGRAVAINPNSYVAYTNLGECYAAEGQIADAVACFEQGTRIAMAPGSELSNADRVQIHVDLASNLVKLGQADEAIGVIEAAQKLVAGTRLATALNTNLAVAYVQRAQQLELANQFDAADRLLGQACVLQPNNADAHNALAISFAKQKHYPEAFQQFELATRLAPENPGYQSNWGRALAASGDFAGAAQHFQLSLALDPASQATAAMLARVSGRSGGGGGREVGR